MTEDKEYVELIKTLKEHSGPVSFLYYDLLPDWSKKEIDTFAEQVEKRKEVLWANYELTQ